MPSPTGQSQESDPQPSEFEEALRQNEALLGATSVPVPSGSERQAVAIPGEPEVPEADPDRELIWTVGQSSVRFNLAALLAKPKVALATPLNATNAVVLSVDGTLCMLARSTDSPSQFLFSAAAAGAYSVAIAVSSIDLEPWARRSSPAKIPSAELAAGLQAGDGVVVGAPNNDGVRKIGAQTPAAGAARARLAEDAYKQTALDSRSDWKIQAIQYTEEPDEINLTWKPDEQIYEGSTEIMPGVTAKLGYVPLSPSVTNSGKFTLGTDTTRTLTTLFSGRTVVSLILKIGANLAAAKAEAPITIPVKKDTATTGTLAMVAKDPRSEDPAGLGTPRANAVALIDFGFAPIYSQIPDKVVSAALIAEALQPDPVIGGITTDGMTLYLLDRQTRKVGAITLATMTVDNDKAIAGSKVLGSDGGIGWVRGIATDGTRVYVAGRTFKVMVFEAGDYVGTLTLEDHTRGITFDGKDLLVGVDTFRHVGDPVEAEVKRYTTAIPTTRVDGGLGPNVFKTEIKPALVKIDGLAWNPDEKLLYVTNRVGRIVAIRGKAHDVDWTPPLTVTGGVQSGGLAYGGGVLWAARKTGPVTPFRVTGGSAYRPAYDFRTVDQAWFRELVRKQVATAAQADNTDEWPLDKLPFEKLTQAQYDAKAANGTIADGYIYLIVG